MISIHYKGIALTVPSPSQPSTNGILSMVKCLLDIVDERTKNSKVDPDEGIVQPEGQKQDETKKGEGH
ncbi:hypothetical protein [Spirosoma endbachense]|uniref:Uncharacterized protein n=1 Tax=Spirosoma endbachense TaxID=2666025 RepID=A0A6P1W5J8_9BACT|nr:hypothetical protein [Spirosoma endbachense]QHV99210.1 hypothetical protein GJR95_31225 [Spirosoma endbachense]